MGLLNNLLKSLRNKYLLLFLLTFIVGASLNVLNIQSLLSHLPEKVRLGETVLTSDDPIYLKPAMNFVDGLGWTDGSVGRQQYFSRPPGYSLFIAPFYALFGLKKGLFFIKFVQLFLFSLSSVCLLKLLEKLTKHNKCSFFISMLYGVFPLASGFVFYTLTEAITPALMIFYVYYLHRAWSFEGKLSFVKAAFVLSILLLVRPVFGMFLLPLGVLVFLQKQFSIKKRIMQFVFLTSLSLLPLFVWQVRVISICGEFPGLYPVYDKDVNTIYRPTHRAIWEFGKCWGISGKDFHEHIGPIWEQVIYRDSVSGNPIQAFIAIIPKDIVKAVGEDKIWKVFLAYQETVKIQKPYLLAKQKLPATIISQEQKVITLVSQLTQNYRTKHWFKYHVQVPLIYLKEMSFHSNLNLYVYQHRWRGSLLMEGVRGFALLLHVGVFVILFLSFFNRNLSLFSRLLGVSSMIYVLFLAYYFRELEERYTLPILPVLFLITAEFITQTQFYSYVQRKIQKV